MSMDADEVLKKCHSCNFKRTRREMLLSDPLETCPNCGGQLEDLDDLRKEIAGIRSNVETLTGVDYGLGDDQ